MNVSQAPETGAPPGTQSVEVRLGERSYRIAIGPGLIAEAGNLVAPHLARPRAFVVTDKTVARHHLDPLEAALRGSGIEPVSLVLEPGEGSKSFAGLEDLSSRLLQAGAERRDHLIALGGGVIGDLTGFAAAVLRRGMPFIQIPTTLLAQVDSSVGGKTGINTPEGKNLVGAFHQPALVLADTDVLTTLPRRELLAGYAEVVKYGLLGDAAFFAWLESHGAEVIEGDAAARIRAIRTSCEAKARIVAEDEREGGRRALLNLGHTFGHALEAATGFSGRLLHGEGVAVGMALAFAFSERLGLAPAGVTERVRKHLGGAGLPVRIEDIPGPVPSAEELLGHMGQDKKVVDGQLTFVLARSIGGAFITQDAPREKLRALLLEEGAA